VPFVADGGPASPVAAVTMFRGAVIAASSAAAERFAALAALAAHAINRQANWQEAIGWVVKAADMGNAAAQLQMKVLPAPKDVRAQGSWLQLARRIDIRGLLSAPSLIRVHGSPAIALIEGLATPAICRWLVQKADSPLRPAKRGGCATGKGDLDPISTRLAAGFGLAAKDTAPATTQKRLELASGLKLLLQKATHVPSYAVGQEYKARFDFFPRRARLPACAEKQGGSRLATV